MSIKNFLDSYNSYEELAIKIAEIASDDSESSIEALGDFLKYKDGNTIGKLYTPKIASVALLNKGRKGIDKLVALLSELDGHIYPKSILDCLWFASKNMLEHFISFYSLKIIEPLTHKLDNETVSYAKNAFYDVVISSSSNNDLFFRFSENILIYQDYLKSKGVDINYRLDIFNMLMDTSLKISQVNIRKLSMLIDMETREENYQKFFKQNPVFIDPIAFRIYDKHKLGDELITDFVVETLKSDYYVVEIEKPQDKIFNKNGDFSQRFIHAFGQIIDFIDWIENNIAYAQKKLPDIASPKGLLIMGRNNMSKKEVQKLRRFNKNSKNIEVFTYDDILKKAENLYKNIRMQ